MTPDRIIGAVSQESSSERLPDNNTFIHSLAELVANPYHIPETLRPFSHRIPPKELYFCFGNLAEFYQTPDLARTLKTYKDNGNVAFILIGGLARRLLEGGSVNTLRDFDFNVVPLPDPATGQLRSFDSVADMVRSITGQSHLGQFRYQTRSDPALWGFDMPEGNHIGLVLFCRTEKDPRPLSAKLFLPDAMPHQAGPYLDAITASIADLVPENRPLEAARTRFQIDQGMVVLIPTPGEKYPLVAISVDPFNASQTLRHPPASPPQRADYFKSEASAVFNTEKRGAKSYTQFVLTSVRQLVYLLKAYSAQGWEVPLDVLNETAARISEIAADCEISYNDLPAVRSFFEKLQAMLYKVHADYLQRGFAAGHFDHPLSPAIEFLIGPEDPEIKYPGEVLFPYLAYLQTVVVDREVSYARALDPWGTLGRTSTKATIHQCLWDHARLPKDPKDKSSLVEFRNLASFGRHLDNYFSRAMRVMLTHPEDYLPWFSDLIPPPLKRYPTAGTYRRSLAVTSHKLELFGAVYEALKEQRGKSLINILGLSDWLTGDSSVDYDRRKLIAAVVTRELHRRRANLLMPIPDYGPSPGLSVLTVEFGTRLVEFPTPAAIAADQDLVEVHEIAYSLREHINYLGKFPYQLDHKEAFHRRHPDV